MKIAHVMVDCTSSTFIMLSVWEIATPAVAVACAACSAVSNL